MKLSVIIPVYQVEDTLKRCVDSVLSQDFADFELLLIDDGATDGSGRLCDDYAATDQRVRVVHQRNGGLSKARNTGLSNARGEYVTFVDSDDTVCKGTYAALMAVLDAHPDYEILEYPAILFYGSPLQRHLRLVPTVYDDMEKYWMTSGGYQHAYAWNKIYKKELFNKIRFPKGKLFEDVYTIMELFNVTHRIATTDKGLYHYYLNPNSITQTATGVQLNDLLVAHVNYIKRHENISAEYYAHVLNIQLDVCELTGNEPILPVLPFKGTAKLRLMHLLGIKRLCLINKYIHKIIPRRR